MFANVQGGCHVPGTARAERCNDLDEAVSFYAKLFGAEPAKLRPGYANFAIAEPPLKLILLENPGQGGSLNHLGVEAARHHGGRTPSMPGWPRPGWRR